MNHFAAPSFWHGYRQLPLEVRRLADEKFALLRQDSRHPSLRLKRIGSYWSVRVGLHYRALARDRPQGLVWFWIGHHSEYDHILKQSTRTP